MDFITVETVNGVTVAINVSCISSFYYRQDKGETVLKMSDGTTHYVKGSILSEFTKTMKGWGNSVAFVKGETK